MAFLWLVYFLAVALTFKEPNRSGLEELKRREEASKLEDGLKDEDADDSSVSTLESEVSNEYFSSTSENSPLYCIKHMTKATALCMTLIFLKRIALEVRSLNAFCVFRFEFATLLTGLCFA